MQIQQNSPTEAVVLFVFYDFYQIILYRIILHIKSCHIISFFAALFPHFNIIEVKNKYFIFSNKLPVGLQFRSKAMHMN